MTTDPTRSGGYPAPAGDLSDVPTAPSGPAPGTVPPVDRTGYEVTVVIVDDVTALDPVGKVDAKLLASTSASLAYELAILACEYHPGYARSAIDDYEESR